MRSGADVALNQVAVGKQKRPEGLSPRVFFEEREAARTLSSPDTGVAGTSLATSIATPATATPVTRDQGHRRSHPG